MPLRKVKASQTAVSSVAADSIAVSGTARERRAGAGRGAGVGDGPRGNPLGGAGGAAGGLAGRGKERSSSKAAVPAPTASPATHAGASGEASGSAHVPTASAPQETTAPDNAHIRPSRRRRRCPSRAGSRLMDQG
ncbi:hypothetical protein GCM10010214_24050 [Streptomyces abikoensis]|nr:hypothetical protein GCM10010214_24050 [Streptomyces abikoensis]